MNSGENIDKFKASLKLKQKAHHTQAYELKKNAERSAATWPKVSFRAKILL